MASESGDKNDGHIYEHDLYFDSHGLLVQAKDVEKNNEKTSFVDVLKAIGNWNEFECCLKTIKETVENVSSNINKAKSKTMSDLKVSIQDVSVKPKDDLNMKIYKKGQTMDNNNFSDSKDGQTSIPITLLIKYCLSNKDGGANTKDQTQKDIKRCTGLCDLNKQFQKDDSQSSFESNHMDSSSSNVNLNSYKNSSSQNKPIEKGIASCNPLKLVLNKNNSEFHDNNKLSNCKRINNESYFVEERPATNVHIDSSNEQPCFINLKNTISVRSIKSIETIKQEKNTPLQLNEQKCADLNQFPPQERIQKLCYGYCDYKNASPYSNSVNCSSQCMCRRNNSAMCLNENGNFNTTAQKMSCQRCMPNNLNQITNMENYSCNNSNFSNRTTQNMNMNDFFKTLNSISYGNMENSSLTKNESSYANRVYENDIPDGNNFSYAMDERSSSDNLENVNANVIQSTNFWPMESTSNTENEICHPQQKDLNVNVRCECECNNYPIYDKNESVICLNNTGCCQCPYVTQSKNNLITSTSDLLQCSCANGGRDLTDTQWCHCDESNHQAN